MTLEEMLQYTAAEFLDDRTELIEGDDDELWSDAYLIRQFNEAQRILCRRAWVIEEIDKAPAARIVLAAGKALYQLHPSVLRVFDATPSTQTYPIGRTDDAVLRAPDSGSVDGSLDAFTIGERAALSSAALTGATLAFASDAATKSIRVSPTPSADQNGVRVALKVARLPVTFLSEAALTGIPEVPEEFHMALCEYAAGKALTLPNVDGDQKVEGRRLLAAFDETVRLARQERQRAEMSSHRWGFSSTTALLGGN